LTSSVPNLSKADDYPQIPSFNIRKCWQVCSTKVSRGKRNRCGE